MDERPNPDALRAPPYSEQAEQAVLGCVLQDNRAFEAAGRIVGPADMYVHAHSLIWAAVRRLQAASKPADVLTVFDALRHTGHDEAAGGMVYLNELASCVPSAAHVQAYSTTVAMAARRRRVIELAADITKAAGRGGVTDDEFTQELGVLIGRLGDMVAGQLDAVPRLVAEMLPDWTEALERAAAGESDAISLGLRGVDRVLAGGARPGELIVLAARPSMGKSAIILGIMRSIAGRGLPVLACSLEDSASMLIARQVAAISRTPLEHVRVPKHAPETLWSAVADAADVLAGLPLYVDDSAGLSLQQVISKAQYVKRKAGGKLGAVVVDYLQLMEDEGETRSNELARIVRGLKNMAKRMHCPVILLSQLSREADKTNAPPRLDHLAESGAIEQAADIIGLLWREARRNPKPDNKHTAQLEFAKNKNGATDTVRLWFDGATQRFDDLED
jgi:replicative DNA helicase